MGRPFVRFADLLLCCIGRDPKDLVCVCTVRLDVRFSQDDTYSNLVYLTVDISF